jgi:nicotinate phosphoribosyltransferase
MVIWQITTQIMQEAPRYGIEPDRVINRLTFGVGTRLVTSQGDPALGGVYKLVAVCENDEWQPAIKISESPAKTPNPGHKQVWRLYDRRGKATADLLGLEDEDPLAEPTLVAHHPSDTSKSRTIGRDEITGIEPLLVDIMRDGRLVYDLPDIEATRKARVNDVERLDAGVRRLLNPHIYHVSLTERLWRLKQDLVNNALAGAK